MEYRHVHFLCASAFDWHVRDRLAVDYMSHSQSGISSYFNHFISSPILLQRLFTAFRAVVFTVYKIWSSSDAQPTRQ